MRRWIAVGAAAGLLLLLGACDWDIARNVESDDAPVDGRVASVRIVNESGDVKIRTGDTTTVRRTVHFDQQRPGATHRLEGDVLVIEDCPVRNCWIDYELTVPAGTRVDGDVSSGSVAVDGAGSVNLKASSGDVDVRGVTGTVNLELDSGNVRLSNIGAAVAVQSGSGDVAVEGARAAVTVAAESGGVRAQGVTGPVDVRSGSGSITVELSAAQNVRARADSGEITVAVPRAAYRVRTGTDSGDVHSDVADDQAGAHTLDLHADSGDITIRYN
ncbi:MAG TPA: DUF4097 family beta strand repeat-containing protein [Actinophytocola sp.]|uniref:DUF4097 family beta strand repeat-containing protein n=1 Tax=Actinophytocola sp. TaxID=1872138 RepID=UPI002DB94F80|nr:DUF4097 family beta strand repeat-containing protein [Actinophytocola sp.]HEU5473021.1 DUF4097 family beta strand repeat-containing protein [Actinophytocola sp.]